MVLLQGMLVAVIRGELATRALALELCAINESDEATNVSYVALFASAAETTLRDDSLARETLRFRGVGALWGLV